jgi:pimeloyl-ACP methyl ester carboxylesterase
MNPDDPTQPAAVALVHGLWTGGWVMALQARRLARCGFRPALFSYDSMHLSLTDAAAGLARFAAALGGPAPHFVGHSLGGLVILRMLALAPTQRTGRIVLLGSPFADSAVTRSLSASRLGRRLLGRMLQDWQDGERPTAAGREVGVLAGHRGIGMGRLVARLASPNDGVVTEAETRVPDMRDFVSVCASHSEMLWSREVARQTCAFLRTGRFVQP